MAGDMDSLPFRQERLFKRILEVGRQVTEERGLINSRLKRLIFNVGNKA